MKKLNTLLFITLLLSLFGMEAYAQVPQGFNFQAVAAGADGTPIAEQEISVQIEIVKGTDEGDIVYTETHSVTTNVVGLFQLTIGQGTAAEGNNFSTVDWGSDNYFVGLGIDITNSGNFVSLGKTRLLSVPYALLAQDVVNGTGTDLPIEYELNTAEGDTGFVVTLLGDNDVTISSALNGWALTSGFNIGVDGYAESVEGNEQFQYGVRGRATGAGTGLHYGLRGEASAPNAWNVAVRGQSVWETTQENYGGWFSGRNSRLRNVGLVSDARDFEGFGVQYNTGVVAIASGPGSGDTENGSYNSGVRAEVNGNTIGNHAISAVAFGDAGVDNAGVYAESNVDDGTTEVENMGVKAFAGGPGRNVALYGSAFNGAENYAGWFDGEVVINGDLTVNGNINGEGGGSGSANGSTLDSLFFATPPENEFQRNTFMYPGYQRYTDQDGNFSVLTRGVLQYGNYNDAGVYNWYNKGGMQVASENYPNGEQAAGMTAGRLYMDIFQNENFYETVNLGTTSAADGGRTYFNMSSLAKKEADGGDLFSINIVNDPNGNDPSGEAAELFAWGESSPNIQMGGMQWENADHAYFQLYGSTQNGDGWYHTNYFMGIGSDGTHEWTNASFMKTDIANQSSEETIFIDGNSGTIRTAGLEIQGDLANDQKFFIGNGSISGGQESYTNGFVLNHDASGGSVFEMYSGGNQTVGIFSSGNANFAGTVTQSSDLRLKTNVATLSNALDNALALRGVSYTWKDANKTQATQIGVIAQEVEEIYPELVRTDDEGMKSVNYTQMVAVLIEAVKELNAKIEVLESENTELRTQVDDIETMKAQINQLMTLISGTQPTETPHSADK